MKTRIITDDKYFYIQHLIMIPDCSGVLDMSREEWCYVRAGFFNFKKKFNNIQSARDYIKSTKEFLYDEYRVIEEYND